MLMTNKRRPVQTLGGWAIAVLGEAGAIRECEHHGWMQDRQTRTHGSGHTKRLARIHRSASRLTTQLLPLPTFWTRLVILAPNARLEICRFLAAFHQLLTTSALDLLPSFCSATIARVSSNHTSTV